MNIEPESSLVQLSSDPICSSAGCTQFKHPPYDDPEEPVRYELDKPLDVDIIAS